MLKHNRIKFEPSKVVFWAVIILSIFLVGGEFSQRDWQPWKMYKEGKHNTKTIFEQTFNLEKRPWWTLTKQRYEGEGVVVYDKAHAYDGYTILQGLFAEGVALELIDMSGNVLHRWDADFFSIWPHPTHIMPTTRIPATKYHYDIHGMWLFGDGSVIFNFSELGTVKLDKCGTVLWTVDRSTHHSITTNPDGSFWIPEKHNPSEVPDNLLFGKISREKFLKEGGDYEDRLLLVDAQGMIIKELSVLQALFDAGFENQLYDAWTINPGDPIHTNDIEVVTTSLANKIEGVNAGDLLVSLRQLHMLIIMDSNLGTVKWHQTGPWVRQHDPDITEDGDIQVFNNNINYTQRSTGSNIINLDLATGDTDIIYPLNGQKPFYSAIQGSHQLLGNGNRMIVESKAGRIFEIDQNGGIVWDYIKNNDETHAAWIEHAIRYEKDYFTVSNWNCVN